MKHSKEPWELKSDPIQFGTLSDIYSGENLIVASTNISVSVEEMEANGKRIVDCVNACAGMENPVEEIAELKQQLTYRDVSEKPEESDWYFCKVKTPYSDKLGDSFIRFSTKVGWICSFDEKVVKWLPIPKE